MEEIVFDLNDLNDSKFLLKSDLPKFGYIIILIIMLILVFFACWTSCNYKTYIVEAEGLIYSDNKSYIVPLITGEIDNIFFEEGDYVSKGQTVIELDIEVLERQLQGCIEQIDLYDKKIKQYNKLLQAIQKGTNDFDLESNDDIFYYSEYKKYENFVNNISNDYVYFNNYINYNVN